MGDAVHGFLAMPSEVGVLVADRVVASPSNAPCGHLEEGRSRALLGLVARVRSSGSCNHDSLSISSLSRAPAPGGFDPYPQPTSAIRSARGGGGTTVDRR